MAAAAGTSSNDDLARSLVARAEKAGAQAIVVTLDMHLLGWRSKDLDPGHLPFARGEGIAQYVTDPGTRIRREDTNRIQWTRNAVDFDRIFVSTGCVRCPVGESGDSDLRRVELHGGQCPRVVLRG